MEASSDNSLKEIYDTFQKELERNINNEKIQLYNYYHYYLIEEIINFSKRHIKFIDNFSSLIDCLKNKRNYTLINQNFSELLLEPDVISKHRPVTYYPGNKKVIIEFKDKSERYALLDFNPFEKKKTICIIEKSDKERNNKKLYENILSKEIKDYNSILKDPELSGVIKTLDNFINNNNIVTDSNNITNQSNQRQNNIDSVNFQKLDTYHNIKNSNNNSKYCTLTSKYKRSPLTRKEKTQEILSNTIMNGENYNKKKFYVKREINNNRNNENEALEYKDTIKDKKILGRKIESQEKDKKNNYLNKKNIEIKDYNIEIIDKLKNQNEDLKKIKNQLEKELNNLKKAYDKKDIIKQENKYKETIEEKGQEIKRIKEDFNPNIKELEKKIETLTKENEAKENKLSKMNEQLKQNEKEINDLNQKKNNYESLLNNKDEEIERLKNESTELYKDINILKEKEKDYVISEQKFKENEDNYKKKINVLEKEKEDLKNKMDKIQNELNKETQKNEKLIEEKEILNKREEEFLIKEQELNKKIFLLEEEKNMMEKERELFNKDKEKNEQIIKDNKELLIKNNELKKKLEEYKLISNKEETIKKEKKKKLMKMDPKIVIIKPKNKMPLLEYKCSTLIGLNNIGAIGFMNAILQCFSQTKSLTNYFLNPYNKDQIINNNIAVQNKDELQLSPVYLELIQKLWDNNMKEPYSPYNFKNTIEAMNSSFKQGQDDYCKEFIVFLLEQFHKELKKSINQQKCFIQKNLSFDQYDKNQTLNYFLDEFKNESSIISDTFLGYNEIESECPNCKNTFDKKHLENPKSYKYEIFNYLIFPLEEIQIMKNNSNDINIQMNENNVVSINDCFDYISKRRINKDICNICKQLVDFISITHICSSPPVLILILKWGKNYNVNLNYKESIDITKYIQIKDSSNIKYNLYGVVTQIEGSNNNVVVASCKSPIDNKWYRFNDAIVKVITNVQKDVIEFGIPYILFYIKS